MSIEENIAKAIETKLTNILYCIVNEVKRNPSFANELEAILLSDSLKRTLREKKKRKEESSFIVMEFLRNHNIDELSVELKSTTLIELKRICKQFGNKIKKNASREQIIEEIIQNAHRKLNQGNSFLK